MAKVLEFKKHPNMEDDTEERRSCNEEWNRQVMETLNLEVKIAAGNANEGDAPKAISMATVLVLENGDIMTHSCGASFPFQLTGALEWLKHRINSCNIENYCPWEED